MTLKLLFLGFKSWQSGAFVLRCHLWLVIQKRILAPTATPLGCIKHQVTPTAIVTTSQTNSCYPLWIVKFETNAENGRNIAKLVSQLANCHTILVALLESYWNTLHFQSGLVLFWYPLWNGFNWNGQILRTELRIHYQLEKG